MKLCPATRTAHTQLTPRAFRSGADTHDHLKAVADGDLPEQVLFVDLYCPARVAAVAMQFEIKAVAADTIVGVATLMDLNPHAGHIRAGVFVVPSAPEPVELEARLLTVNYAFATSNLRKVYVHEAGPAHTWAPPIARTEGTLRQFVHDGSRNLDVDVNAIYRADWDSYGVPRVDEITATGGRL